MTGDPENDITGWSKTAAKAMTGATDATIEYIKTLNVKSPSDLGLFQLIELGTHNLKENTVALLQNIGAWAKSPFGIATIAAVGIFAIVKAIDYYDGALERSREKLSGLKEEYTSVSSELSSLENELDSTAERLEELENLNKSGAITIAEKEELDLLRQQNSELDRKINLLKQEQALKQREINATFIETFDQDIGNSNVIADGTEDGSYKTVSDGEILQGKIELYRKNLQRIKRIEEETEASVNNAMEAGDYALATRLQDKAKAQVKQLENANKNSITTVSEHYAQEVLAQKDELSTALSSTDYCGITNGILYSAFSPEKGLLLSAKYNADDQYGKLLCKDRILKTYGIEGNPFICMVMGRLIKDKGIEDILNTVHCIRDNGGFLIIVGKAETPYDKLLKELSRSDGVIFIDRWASQTQVIPMLSGADFYLSPSIVEPCGLMPMTASRYGTIPITTLAGGLADNFNSENSIIIDESGLEGAIGRASELYRNKSALHAKRKVCMEKDFSWETRKKSYIELYEKGSKE